MAADLRGYLPLSRSYSPKALRCRSSCGRVLDELRAFPTATKLNVHGTNHQPSGKDRRAARVDYGFESRPGSYGMDQHRWRCTCGADWLLSQANLDAAFVRANDLDQPEIGLPL